MELVCREKRKPYNWYYDPVMELYFRENDDGDMNGRIYGKELPNPAGIYEARTRAIQDGKLVVGSRTYADPVTVKLWEHWNA